MSGGFTDVELAARYDLWSPPAGRADYAFHAARATAAESVLDVGCGTGSFLALVRDAGHPGRLVGVDPAEAMLAVARARLDVEWLLGDAVSAGFEREFELAVMTGHAFQELITDDDVRLTLAAVRRALGPGGRFVFDTRNPAARAWERWTPEHGVEATDADGARFRLEHEVDGPVDEAAPTFMVSLTSTLTGPYWPQPRRSGGTLRFTTVAALDELLTSSGLTVVERYGDFAGGPFTADSPEIVTVVARA
jgi:SAM-dependent methyltransferase